MGDARWTTGLWLAAMAGCTSAPAARVAPRSDGIVASAAVSRPYAASPDGERGDRHAGWRPVQGFSARWNTIVIHHSGGDVGGAERLGDFHAAPRSRGGLGSDELAWHFVIGNGTDTGDGEIEVGPRWRKQKHGGLCTTRESVYDDHGIGICLVGDFDVSRPSEKQMAALAELVGFLLTECRIPASEVHPHQELAALVDCPGTRFVLAELERRLASTRLVSTRP